MGKRTFLARTFGPQTFGSTTLVGQILDIPIVITDGVPFLLVWGETDDYLKVKGINNSFMKVWGEKQSDLLEIKGS